jgi:hypothetical protein
LLTDRSVVSTALVAAATDGLPRTSPRWAGAGRRSTEPVTRALVGRLPRLYLRRRTPVVFTGLFYRDQIAEYYRANGLPEPYNAHVDVSVLSRKAR